MGEILIVSPPSRDVDVLQAALTAQRRRVRQCRRPEDGLAYARAGEVDLVIAELEMAPLSGPELLAAVREQVGAEAPPFVLMGELSHAAAAGHALQAGAVDFLPRPVEPGEAMEIVGRALGEAEFAHPAAASEEILFEAEDGVLVVRCPRRVDYDMALKLTEMLDQDFVPPERGLLVDLARTEYLASTAMGALHLLAERCGEMNDRAFVFGASPRLVSLLEMTGAFHFYKPVASEDEARAAL